MRRLPLLLTVLLASCATQTTLPRSLDLVREDAGTLSWAGLRIGMRPAEVRRALRSRVRMQHDPYSEMCGESFSVARMAGRPVTLYWSSNDESAELEVIGVPLTDVERQMSDIELSRLARTMVPNFIDAVAVEYDTAPDPDPTSFVLANNHDVALLIKSDPQEENLLITVTACID